MQDEEYQVKRAIHTAPVDAEYARIHGFGGVSVGIPRHHLEGTHYLVADRPSRLVSARYCDRRTGSQLLFGGDHLTFVPGASFRLDEPLYVHYKFATARNAPAQVS